MADDQRGSIGATGQDAMLPRVMPSRLDPLIARAPANEGDTRTGRLSTLHIEAGLVGAMLAIGYVQAAMHLFA